MIYYLITIALSAFSFVESLHVDLRKMQNAFYIFILIFLAVFAGTRMMGFDYETYKDIFSYASSGDLFGVQIEIGWALICYLFGGFGFNAFLLFVACCSIVLYGIFFRKYSPYIFLSLLIYYSSYFIVKEMGQMRQGLAIGIVTFAFTAAMEKKKGQFALLFLMAFCIHYSAIVTLPVYYLCNHQWKTTTIVAFIAFGLCFTFIDLGVILAKVISILPISGAQDKVANILVSDASAKKLGINSSIILRIIIMGMALAYRKPLSERFAFYEPFLMLYFYGLMLYLVFNSVSEFAQRTSAYFRILEAIILPCILALMRRRAERLVVVGLLVLNAAVSINRLFGPAQAYEAYNPYKTYLLD
ncbi:EpsG family protein [Chitinophaga ginsengisoli]|uniref:EpsG-like putative glucosyltransferase n=1 Tax=Chitinophaga ginsengisoli TaxID=363837 RepID=A0A2P8GPI2_9BACT|nr:EpsG family protein [Chitinophaga ginsengisoli]PSL35873.1 EpsG-like putative glucosyltransferase [Chitinophaga ginsengisoli]